MHSSNSTVKRRRPRVIEQVGIQSTSVILLSSTPSSTDSTIVPDLPTRNGLQQNNIDNKPELPHRNRNHINRKKYITELRCHNLCGISYEAQELNVYLQSEDTVVSNTTDSSNTYKNPSPEELYDDHDSFSDSFDSDSDESTEFNHKDSHFPIHERSLPPPPISSSNQLNQNIYGFVKQAGRQMKKHWSLSSLGLNKIRKLSVGAISTLPVSLPKQPEPDIKPTVPIRTRRWSSFKSKFRPHTTSTFYLDQEEESQDMKDSPNDAITRHDTITPQIHLKNEIITRHGAITRQQTNLNNKSENQLSSPPQLSSLPQQKNKTEPYAVSSPPLSSSIPLEKDMRRMSIALRPSSPPPPPPVNKSISSDDSNSTINNSKLDGSINSSTTPSWYAQNSIFDSSLNGSTISDPDKSASPQGSAYWYSSENNLWDSGNSSTPAASTSDSMSDPGSDLHLRFIDEPLYQFYNACITELQFNETMEENGYEEIGSANRPSMLEIINPSILNRSLWCQLPEVIDSGLLDTLDPSQRKLQEAKFELITSEASYFKSLTVLEKHFIASPLLNDDTIVCKNDRKHLFGNVNAVRKCSEKLLAALEQCWQDSILLSNICEIVYQHVTNKNFNIYIKYCSNQFHIDRTLKTLRQNPKFCEKLVELENNSICQSLSLHSFLMLPMQRITRLPLLFDAIMTRLKPNHSEYETCHTTLATLNKIVHECNEEARKMERYYEMLLLSRLLKFSLKEVKGLPVISSSRWLVRSGSMTFVNVDNKVTFNRKLSKNYFYSKLNLFLFTDLLVITKKKSDGSFAVIDYCPRAMIQMVAIEDSIPPTNKYLLLLTMLENHESKTVEMVLSCDTDSGRQRWLEATSPPASSNPEETLYEQWDCPQVAVNHTYTAQQPDELNLQPGDVINVLRKMSDGWYHGERIRDSQKGWFPGNYTTEIASSHARAKNLKQRYRLLALSGSYLQSKELSQSNKKKST